jgi:hypothetical protein
MKPIDVNNADAMNVPIRRPWCSDDKPMTPAKIVAIVKAKGEFRVTWHYRNDNLRRVVSRLCAAKVLWCKSNRRGEAVYVLHKNFGKPHCDLFG